MNKAEAAAVMDKAVHLAYESGALCLVQYDPKIPPDQRFELIASLQDDVRKAQDELRNLLSSLTE